MTLPQKIKAGAAIFISIAALNTQAAPSCGDHLCTPQELDCMENPALCSQAPDPSNQNPNSQFFLEQGFSFDFSYSEATLDAVNKANAECAPRAATRVTPFQFHHASGRQNGVSASAYFKCD